MAEFTWEARGRTGEVRKGVMEAENEEAVNNRLRQQQLAPVKVKKKSRLSDIKFGSPKASTKDLVTFTRLFATMIDAGLPLVQCLEILGSQQSNPAFGGILKDVRSAVEQGATFSEALKRHPKVFDDLFTNLVHAGEVGGILDGIMSRLSVYLEKRQKLIRQVRGALVYPTVVLVIAILVMTLLLTFVIPSFEGMFKDFGGKAQLPWLTRVMVAISHNFVSYFPFIVVAVILLLVGFGYMNRTPGGKAFVHRTILKLPIIGSVLRKIAVARFTRTLGTLLQSGVPILDSLEICAVTSGNVVIEAAVMHVRQSISEGKNMAEPLTETKVFPDMVVQMIAVGEQTGALDQMLNKIADFYEEETDVAVGALTSALEPIMMVGVGGMVGVVLIAMYLPVFSLAGNIKGD
jgi:type IV pilus assembly protein PilC